MNEDDWNDNKQSWVHCIIAFLFGGGLVAFIMSLFNKKKIDHAYEKGCIDTSKDYEEKLKKQTEDFLAKKQLLESDIKEYQDLIEKYDKIIEELQAPIESNPQNKDKLALFKENRSRLLGIPKE